MTRPSESVNMDPCQRQLGTRVDSPDETMLYPPLERNPGRGRRVRGPPWDCVLGTLMPYGSD